MIGMLPQQAMSCATSVPTCTDTSVTYTLNGPDLATPAFTSLAVVVIVVVVLFLVIRARVRR